MGVKKRNSLFGRYPSCDMVNNAIRFLLEDKKDEAISELVFAIHKAGGYFHKDVADRLKDRFDEDLLQ